MNFNTNQIVTRTYIRCASLTLALLFLGVAKLFRAQVTVYRDSYGLPSVASNKLVDAIYGLGYAMALDNAESMARNYKQARGRLAEVDGKSKLLQDGSRSRWEWSRLP